MKFKRASGILLHPTSFPGRFGIGDLGMNAYEFVDFLAAAGQQYWQVMPLCQTGYGDSPYQTLSAFAGNPYLISFDNLIAQKLLTEDDLLPLPAFPVDKVDYGPVIEYKVAILKKAFEHFKTKINTPKIEPAFKALGTAYTKFKAENAGWLDDFALFMAVKEANGGECWVKWKKDIALREPAALADWRKKAQDTIESHIFNQFIFYLQWTELKAYAHKNGIQVIGDLPIFVASDSADVWAHRDLFHLDDKGKSTVVAGVPPDYFSKTGQLWGNPLYKWEVMEKKGFAWWIDRMRFTHNLYDIIRLDHFRGFEAYWEVSGKAKTAVKGKWVNAPGKKLFAAIEKALGKIPIIAEDLGVITPQVNELREQFDFPGMKVLQFAFGGKPTCPDLPHNFTTSHCVVYTATHDNNTTKGWYQDTSTPLERDFVRRYLGVDGNDIAWNLIRLALFSIADIAIIPMQDMLSLGSEARMNFPSTAQGNWGWRLQPGQINPALASGLREFVFMYGRMELPKPKVSGQKAMAKHPKPTGKK